MKEAMLYEKLDDSTRCVATYVLIVASSLKVVWVSVTSGRTKAGELGPETPWHISRFTPAYKMVDVPSTPISTLLQAQEIGQQAGLRYIYVGNVPNKADTICHVCNQLLIRRFGYQVLNNNIEQKGYRPSCGTAVAGVGMAEPVTHY
jgi:pyruvate formate lyase activating enzyme